MTLKTESVQKDQILKVLEEQHIFVNRYAEMFFSHPSFDAEIPGEITVTAASLREAGLEDGGTLDEIFQRVRKLGGRPCPLSTGLYLRLAWEDQPESGDPVLSGTHRAPDGAVTVLTEFLERDDSFPKGLYLRNVEGRLWLRGYVCDDQFRFSGDDMFVFETDPDGAQ